MISLSNIVHPTTVLVTVFDCHGIWRIYSAINWNTTISNQARQQYNRINQDLRRKKRIYQTAAGERTRIIVCMCGTGELLPEIRLFVFGSERSILTNHKVFTILLFEFELKQVYGIPTIASGENPHRHTLMLGTYCQFLYTVCSPSRLATKLKNGSKGHSIAQSTHNSEYIKRAGMTRPFHINSTQIGIITRIRIDTIGIIRSCAITIIIICLTIRCPATHHWPVL